MPQDHVTYASEQEMEQMRAEIRSLREEQEHQKQHAPQGDGQQPQEQEQQEHHVEAKKPHTLRNWIILAVVLIVAAAGLLWWLHSRKFESTDDAQVEAHLDGLAARVAGTVTAVYVEENQYVQAGQIVADLDPQDYSVAVQAARSQVAQAVAQSQSEQPNVPVTQTTTQTAIATAAQDVAAAEAGVAAATQNYQAAAAKVQEAEANNAKAQSDVERFRPLAEKDEVPREQFDQVVATAKALAATVTSAQAAAQAAQKQIDQSRATLAQAQQRASQAQQNAPRELEIRKADVVARQAAIQAAQAQLKQAELNLSYSKIVSPVAGIVAQRAAEVGQHVTPGQQIVLISQIDDLWVTANFKETQLRRMHPDQGVVIHVDALGRDFDGYVESMPAASGSVISLLPPENATGNFVKVVQRLPVRIRFKPNQSGMELLRPGMSVEPQVRVQ
jgi:membrane fusion protein (multidrug efflux system)